jgi:hypothetical protein
MALISVEEAHSAPCRVSLQDAAVGETVLLLNFQHQQSATAFAASGPLFIRQNATEPAMLHGTVPDCLQRRLLSIRAYDAQGWMRDADVTPGNDATALIHRLFEDSATAYLHIHYARRGCYACRVERA